MAVNSFYPLEPGLNIVIHVNHQSINENQTVGLTITTELKFAMFIQLNLYQAKPAQETLFCVYVMSVCFWNKGTLIR